MVFEPLHPLLLAPEQFLLRSRPLLLRSWLRRLCQGNSTAEAQQKAHLVVGYTGYTVDWHLPPPSVRPNPKIGMDLVLWNDLALQEMTHDQIVVHRFADNLRDRGRVEFDEPVVLGSTGL